MKILVHKNIKRKSFSKQDTRIQSTKTFLDFVCVCVSDTNCSGSSELVQWLQKCIFIEVAYVLHDSGLTSFHGK